jgi:hypothetical protein
MSMPTFSTTPAATQRMSKASQARGHPRPDRHSGAGVRRIHGPPDGGGDLAHRPSPVYRPSRGRERPDQAAAGVSEPGRGGPGPPARRRQGPARSGESDLLGPPRLPELRPSRVLFQHRQSSSLSRKHGHGRPEVARLTDGKGAEEAFDPVGGTTFGHLAEANASGAILVVYGRLSSDATPLPLAHVIWKGLTICGFGPPLADDAKLAALKQFWRGPCRRCSEAGNRQSLSLRRDRCCTPLP